MDGSGLTIEFASRETLPSNGSAAGNPRIHQMLIVDDHPVVREGLRAIFSQQPDLVVAAQVGGIESALHVLESNHIDIAMIDISLKDENGLALVRQIRNLNKSIKILVFSVHDESLYGPRSLAAGARGYLNKQATTQTIIDVVRQIIDGKRHFSQELLEKPLNSEEEDVDLEEVAPSVARTLSRSELTVFRFIGAGCTTAEIAKNLHLSIKTIESHRQKIKRKLNLSNAAMLSRAAAQWALQNQ